MRTFAFCTITYGDKYLKLGDNIINQLTSLGHTFYVLTTDPERYTSNANVVAVKYTHSYFSFHQKRLIIRECLKKFDTAIFLDADVVLQGDFDFKSLESVPPGLHIFATFGNIGLTFLNTDNPPCRGPNLRNTKYGNDGRRLLDALGFKYIRDFHGTPDYLEHFLEGKWMISRDGGREQLFLDNWEKIANLCEETDIRLGFTSSIGAGEGGAMSIAAFNSGILIHCTSPYTSCINKHFISNYQEKIEGTKPWNIAG